jgi:hypothetical protein
METRTLIERVKRLILNTDETWETVKLETTTIPDLLREYVFKLAAVPALSHFLGWWVIVGFWSSLTRALVLYALSIVAVWATSKIIAILCGHYGVEEDDDRTFKLAAFGFTPYFVAGVCYAIPPFMLFVPIGGMFGFYLLLRGIPAVLGIPAEKSATTAILVSGAMFLMFIIIGRVTGGVLWPHKP